MRITLLTGRTSNKIAKIKEQIPFDIKVNMSSRAKKMTLRIDAKNHLPILSIPASCSAKKAIEFVLSHQLWIEKSLSSLPIYKKFSANERFSLFGEDVTIVHTPTARRGVYLQENQLFVCGAQEFIHRRIKDYIKKEAKKNFYTLSKQLAKKLQCNLQDVCIKDTKSRWGSCSSLGNINYSWRISLAPKYVITYLIAHEVSHLKHPNHSIDFWNCVNELEPQSFQAKEWLKIHGKDLYIYE